MQLCAGSAWSDSLDKPGQYHIKMRIHGNDLVFPDFYIDIVERIRQLRPGVSSSMALDLHILHEDLLIDCTLDTKLVPSLAEVLMFGRLHILALAAAFRKLGVGQYSYTLQLSNCLAAFKHPASEECKLQTPEGLCIKACSTLPMWRPEDSSTSHQMEAGVSSGHAVFNCVIQRRDHTLRHSWCCSNSVALAW